jgi:HTH-type transcriptional regulator / antitoxin HigA
MTPDRSISPPGRLIALELKARGWDQQTLADVMGVSTTLVSEVVNAKRAITPDTAALLASAFGTDGDLWLGLEARYRSSLPKPARTVAAERRQKLYAKVPVRAMIRRGWLPDTKDIDELERRVLDFAELPSLDEEFVIPHAAKTFGPPKPPKPEQGAWLFRARQLARLVTVTRAWRPGRVGELVGELSRLIMSPPALCEVPRILADFGIRFVALERLPGMCMDGATFWLDASKPVIALSFTHDRVDNAVHTLFHEVDHVEHREASIDENVLSSEDNAENERRANTFATRTLVPQDKLDDFCARVAPLFSELKIRGFSERIRVHPGIVVGQLHNRAREGRSGLPHTHLRRFLVPVRSYMAGESAMTEGWGRIAPVFPGEQE